MIFQIQIKAMIFLGTLFLTLMLAALVWGGLSGILTFPHSVWLNLAILSVVTLSIPVVVFLGLRQSVLKGHKELTSCFTYGLITTAILAEAYLVLEVIASLLS
jgi:hypothetical protein